MATHLVGFTSRRNKNWFKTDATSYEEEIPFDDVKEKLFNWQGISHPMAVVLGDGTVKIDDSRQVILRSDTNEILGVFKTGYKIHQYTDWLLDVAQKIVKDGLSIARAGVLELGGTAYVQFELPDNSTEADVEYRPYLLAVTSMNGKFSSTFLTMNNILICDNQITSHLTRNGDNFFRVKHTSNSLPKVAMVQDALGLLKREVDYFAEQVRTLSARRVTDEEWCKFLDAHVKVTKGMSKRSENAAVKKRDTLHELWTSDERATPWKNTAWGVIAAVNTYNHHFNLVRNASREDRNVLRVITGQGITHDFDALSTLNKILG